MFQRFNLVYIRKSLRGRTVICVASGLTEAMEMVHSHRTHALFSIMQEVRRYYQNTSNSRDSEGIAQKISNKRAREILQTMGI